MPRRREVPKRRITPDPKFKDKLVSKFMNVIMYGGKKATAEGIIYGAFDLIQERQKEDPLEVFRKALDNAKPKLEVKSRRVGGATYQVPVEVRPERRVSLAMRWLTQYSRDRGEKTMRERLAAELMDAAAGRGNAVKKRDDTHKMAEANKAFAHYRWLSGQSFSVISALVRSGSTFRYSSSLANALMGPVFFAQNATGTLGRYLPVQLLASRRRSERKIHGPIAGRLLGWERAQRPVGSRRFFRWWDDC
jgi:small subunit ribosomal protein S7